MVERSLVVGCYTFPKIYMIGMHESERTVLSYNCAFPFKSSHLGFYRQTLKLIFNQITRLKGLIAAVKKLVMSQHRFVNITDKLSFLAPVT